jgi:hypothetical protein
LFNGIFLKFLLHRLFSSTAHRKFQESHLKVGEETANEQRKFTAKRNRKKLFGRQ